VTAAGELTEQRRTWDDPGAATTATPQENVTRTLLRGVVNPAGRPPFSYVNASGSCVGGCDAAPTVGVAATDIGGVFEVRIRLQREIVGDRDPIEVETIMVLRNAVQG
jgi:hypothetical protein